LSSKNSPFYRKIDVILTKIEIWDAYGSPAGESDCPWAMAMNGSDIHGS
jgi:hypothetical protein